MSGNQADSVLRLMSLMFRAHPWHGVSIGDQAPEVVTAYIEIVPTDTVKYEVDKVSGFLKVDRPQRFSNYCPVYYGLVPQTYCGEVELRPCFPHGPSAAGVVGDGDPLDICVLTEKTIPHSDILLTALPIGGLSMADGGEADDKIIAVMKDDATYGGYTDIGQVPLALLDRLQHYFLTYKSAPGSLHHKVEITSMYGREEALNVIRTSHVDYKAKFPELEMRWGRRKGVASCPSCSRNARRSEGARSMRAVKGSLATPSLRECEDSVRGGGQSRPPSWRGKIERAWREHAREDRGGAFTLFSLSTPLRVCGGGERCLSRSCRGF